MDNYICEHCNIEYSTKSNLTRHQKTKQCLIVQHAKGIHINDVPMVTCEHCSESVRRDTNFKRHQELCKKYYVTVNNHNVTINNYYNETKEEKLDEEEKIDEEENVQEDTKDHYIYCLIEREFLKTKENIYKIGKSTSLAPRMRQYPKGSKIIAMSQVNNCDIAETDLIKVLDSNKKFKRASDVGREYYECNTKDLLSVFHEICMKHN